MSYGRDGRPQRSRLDSDKCFFFTSHCDWYIPYLLISSVPGASKRMENRHCNANDKQSASIRYILHSHSECAGNDFHAYGPRI